MVTKVTDSVMDLTDVRQDITLGFNDDEARQSKIVGLVTPTDDDEATSKKYVDDTIAALIAVQVPAGMGPLPWSGTAAPTGWLLCDGTAVSRTTYSDLFSVVGTTYGVGDGSTTFNVPDLRGRFPLGRNTSGLAINRVNRTQAQNLGQVSGQENYALQTNEGPNHIHPVIINNGGLHTHGNAITSIDGEHTHPFTSSARVWQAPGGSGTDAGGEAVVPLSILPEGDHNHTVTVPSTNSNHDHTGNIGTTPVALAHENTPPFLTVNYIIKT